MPFLRVLLCLCAFAWAQTPKIAIYQINAPSKSQSETINALIKSAISSLGSYEYVSLSDLGQMTKFSIDKEKFSPVAENSKIKEQADQKFFASLSDQLGVQLFISGSLDKIASRYVLNLSLYDQSSAKTIKSVSAQSPNLEGIIDQIPNTTAQLLSQQVPPTHNAGTLSITDPRDGQIYSYQQIGSYTWMLNNLNFEIKGTVCYDNKIDNCQKWGHLYDFKSANKACPKGWHLPSDAEWLDLESAIGLPESELKVEDMRGSVAHKIKSPNWGGDSNSVFNINGGGYQDPRQKANGGDQRAFFWTSTAMETSKEAMGRRIDRASKGIFRKAAMLSYQFSVRCVQD